MSDQHEHHILPYKVGFGVFIALLVFTVITVAVAQVDLGILNFPVAMAIATCKALMVTMLFMGLKYDTTDNRVIFFGSLIFVAIFVVLTASDLFFRGDVRTKGSSIAPIVAKAKSKFKKPWNSTPEIVAHGKGLYEVNCASCHGDGGKGDGIAAAALNPKPRDFTVGGGWTNGRKPSEVFKTLRDGLNSMPSFTSLPAGDRWALSHYVATLGPDVLKDTMADYKKIGLDPNAEGAGEEENKTIPVDAAIELMATDGKL